jgi:hypothetical protein
MYDVLVLPPARAAPLADQLVQGEADPGHHERQAREQDLGVPGGRRIVVPRGAVHTLHTQHKWPVILNSLFCQMIAASPLLMWSP